jgi:hypothetical protein
MGYILSSIASPDAALIAACARYIGDEDNGGLTAISRMTATTPAGWYAIAAAADRAADCENDGHMAELIFVMQRSLLGKRKRILDLPPRLVEPEIVEPAGTGFDHPLAHDSRESEARFPRGATKMTDDGLLTEPFAYPRIAEIVEPWCSGRLATDRLSSLGAKIHARQELARGMNGAGRPEAAYRTAEASLIAPEHGRLFAIA